MWKIVKRSGLWGIQAGSVFFCLGFFLPLLIGGPGSAQGPLAGFILGPVAFILGALAGWLASVRRFKTLSTAGKAVYVVGLLLLLFPSAGAIRIVPPMVVGFASIRIPDPHERMQHAAALTPEERALLANAHFNATVGVSNPRMPPAYTTSLIDDLITTGLFDRVANGDEHSDFVATVKNGYWGDQSGQHFTLARAGEPDRQIDINVYYTFGGLILASRETRQYRERLKYEIVKAMNELSEARAAAE